MMINQQIGDLTDEQIRDKAHKIWLSRQESGEPGNADSDWNEAVTSLLEENNNDLEKSVPKFWYVLGFAAVLVVSMLIWLTLDLF